MNVASYVDTMTANGFRLAAVLDSHGKAIGISTFFPTGIEGSQAVTDCVEAEWWRDRHCSKQLLADELTRRGMVVNALGNTVA